MAPNTMKFFIFCLSASLFLSSIAAQTTYSRTCPDVERIIRETIRDSGLNRDKTIPAALIRLHFHDCFVDGCDGSLLLDSTPTDGTDVEKLAAGNNNSIRGTELIEEIKTKLEAACPGVVSCADILAMAARDSGVFMNGPYYTVPTGRFDGRRSSRTLANARLPSPFMSYTQLKDNFAEKRLSVQDLVLLSGGHTIGRSKCRFFEQRVYNYSSTGRPAPDLNPEYLAMLRDVCKPRGANPSPTNTLDKDSEFTFDNTYYKNLVLKNGLLQSDVELINSPETANMVRSLADDNSRFFQLYSQSMINMGNVQWKTRSNGEIRKKCNAVNSNSLITTAVGDVASSLPFVF